MVSEVGQRRSVLLPWLGEEPLFWGTGAFPSVGAQVRVRTLTHSHEEGLPEVAPN